MTYSPLIYIIIVNYKNYNDTIECISSINKNNYNNYKIIIVDNHSNNGSYEMIKKVYPDIKIIVTDKNLGFAYGNNIGIKEAIKNMADFIILLNNDTIVDKNFISNIIDKIKNNKELGIGTGKILYYDDKKTIWYSGGSFNKYKGNAYHIRNNDINSGFHNKQKEVTFISGCYMIIPCRVIKDIGLLDEKYFMYFEDVDYCLRIINKYKLIYFPESIIYHKVSRSVGYNSKMHDYYYTRNRCILIKSNLNFPFNIVAFTYFYITRLIKYSFNKQKRSIIIKGIYDFLTHKWGYQEI